MKMSGSARLLVNCSSMEVSNLLEFLKSGVVDDHISSIFGITLRSQGGAVVSMVIMVMVPLVMVPSLESGVEVYCELEWRLGSIC